MKGTVGVVSSDFPFKFRIIFLIRKMFQGHSTNTGSIEITYSSIIFKQHKPTQLISLLNSGV